MKLREDLNGLTPRLRRYARALMSGDPGGFERADDLVHATLIRALGSRNLGMHADLVIRLYATLTQMHRDIAGTETGRLPGSRHPAAFGARTGAKPAPSIVRQSKLALSLMNLALEDREVLLLVALEGFNYDEAARILHVTKTVLLTRLTRARLAMDAQLEIQPCAVRNADQERAPASHLRLVK